MIPPPREVNPLYLMSHHVVSHDAISIQHCNIIHPQRFQPFERMLYLLSGWDLVEA